MCGGAIEWRCMGSSNHRSDWQLIMPMLPVGQVCCRQTQVDKSEKLHLLAHAPGSEVMTADTPSVAAMPAGLSAMVTLRVLVVCVCERSCRPGQAVDRTALLLYQGLAHLYRC